MPFDAQFKQPPITSLAVGFLACLIALPLAPLVSVILLMTPAIAWRSRRLAGLAVRDGLLIWIISFFLVGLPLSMDSRDTMPFVWLLVPSISLMNPWQEYLDLACPIRAAICYFIFGALCFTRLASLLRGESLFHFSHFRLGIIAALAGTILFRASWVYMYSEYRQAEEGGTLTECIVSLFMLAMSWAIGGYITARFSSRHDPKANPCCLA